MRGTKKSRLPNSEFDKHNLWVLNEASVISVYEFIGRLVSEEGYHIVYAAEGNPETTLKGMVKAGFKEAPLQVEEGALGIVDRARHYSEDSVQSPDNQSKWALWEAYFKSQYNGDSTSTKRLIIGMPLGYFYPQIYHNNLISYEQEFDVAPPRVEAICLYTRGLLQKSSLSNLVWLVNSHESILHGSLLRNRWNPVDIIVLMRKGLNRALSDTDNISNDKSNLVFSTLKLIYHMDDQFIVGHPDIFEDTIRKMFVGSAEKIFKCIVAEIIKEIVYDGELNLRDNKSHESS
jgi:hypothetical protein